MLCSHRILNGLDKVDPSTWFTMRCKSHDRNTRLSSDPLTIATPSSRLALRSNFFSVRVVSQWNQLPLSVRQAKTSSMFKSACDSHMSSQSAPQNIPIPATFPPSMSRLIATDIVNDVFLKVCSNRMTLSIDFNSLISQSVIATSLN